MTFEFIGASGLMGHGMAKNLLDAGATLADNVAALGASYDIMVGAIKASFAKIEPVLKCCAENVFHIGEPR